MQRHLPLGVGLAQVAADVDERLELGQVELDDGVMQLVRRTAQCSAQLRRARVADVGLEDAVVHSRAIGVQRQAGTISHEPISLPLDAQCSYC